MLIRGSSAAGVEKLDRKLRDDGARFRRVSNDIGDTCAENIARCTSVPLDEVRALLRP